VSFFANGRFVDDPQFLLDGRPTPKRIRAPRWVRRRMIERRFAADLVHGPNYFLPPEAAAGIVTVHDLSVFRYPDTHPEERVRAFERQFGSSLDRAFHVITDTQSVRDELVADLGVPASKVTPIALGVADEYRPREAHELRSLLEPLGLKPGGYALCVSTLEPRKKISELLRAWRELPEDMRSSTPLVLAGAKGWRNDQLHQDIRDGVTAGWLRHPGFVPEDVLVALYAGASLFIYPSIYEGFGLPTLEAMASGTPVLVADRAALREVCGDAAGYIEPDDVTAFAKEIARALTDSSWRSRAREKGLERAAGFSWQKCAAETVELYRRCAS
jgi:alpha-1,3-rhamnosyl/mannosyltransferase